MVILFQSACFGDSGGPIFFVGKDNVAYLVGIIARTYNGGDSQGNPLCGIMEKYTDRIPFFETVATSITTEIINWIKSQETSGLTEFSECLQASGYLKRKDPIQKK